MTSWIKAGACVAATIVGALAASAGPASVTPLEAGISAHVALTSLDFTPVKKPKVALLPHDAAAGLKKVVPKIVSFTSTQIDVEVTKGLAGVYDVVVTPRDKGVAPETLPNTLTIVVPHPASLDPTSGPWKTLLTIHGADFGTPRGRVTIGGKNAAVKHWTDDTIRVMVPPRIATGPQPVVVKNKAGDSDGSPTFDCTGAPPKPGPHEADEWIRADLSGKGHFEATNAKTGGFYVTYDDSKQQLTFGGTSQPTLGAPNVYISMLPLDVTRAVPYDVGLSPNPPVTTIATCGYGEAKPVAALHVASLGATGASLTITITGWDGTFLDGTFSGTLVDLVGGTAPIVVTNGQFRTRRVTGH
jgi:hypothetical protein